MIGEWHYWPLVSEGSNAKCLSMYRAILYCKTCPFAMSVVSWLRNIERRGEIKMVVVISCVYCCGVGEKILL